MNCARISRAAVLASALMTTYASALGLGEAKLKSWLGQSLNATVTLTDTQDLSVNDILVRQIYGKSAQQLNFQDAINNPRYLISTETDAQSNMWVKVGTQNPINEPYVSFVLQVEMPGGSVNREYTLLIDMPPGSVEDSSNFKRNNKSALTDETQYLTDNSSNTYTVQNGDTLGQIAQSIRPDENIRLKAIIQYLYDRNPSSFEDGDPNQLIQGATLILPSLDEYAAMPKRQRLTRSTPKIHRSAPPPPTAVFDKNRYTTYIVKPGDTLSQVADAIRPSKRIPLHAATQTLIYHNIAAVGDFGGRLSIGQLLRVPEDDIFYLEASLPLNTSNQSTIEPQVATKRAEPKVPQATAAIPDSKKPRPLELDNDITPNQREQSPKENYRPLNTDELLNDSQQLQNTLNAISGQIKELQAPELLSKIDQLMALQEEQVAMAQRLINAQRMISRKDNLAQKVILTSSAIKAEDAIDSAPIHLYALIALLSLMVMGLSAKLYWPLNLKRKNYTPAHPEPESTPPPCSKVATEHKTTVKQPPSTDSKSDRKDSMEPVSELDLDLDLDLDDTLIPEAPAIIPHTIARKNKITRGESAESEQHDKDRKLHQKLAERNLEASNTPAFDNNFIDSAPVNLNDIFQPGDEDGINVLSNSHQHVANDVESDVIWQANIYSAYGQHSRAENLLNEGLHANSKSIALKLALLDIYARSEQHEQFERLCTNIPQDDPSVRASIQQWREEFNIPPNSDTAQM